MQNINFWIIFSTGLLAGGLTCLAVQGGLLMATIAQREEERLKEHVKKGAAVPILSFLIAKLVAYTILGLLLGWLGSLLKLSLTTQIVLQLAVAIFMVGTALALLNVHPIFRYFIIQPPKFLTRLVRNQSKSKEVFAPALLGAFTIFIPCGTTQAMMALAIASGSPITGAAILYAFVLGTSPLFFLFGYFATKLGDVWHKKFLKVAALAIVLLAAFNLNNIWSLTGSQWTLGKVAKSAACAIAYCEDQASIGGPTVSEVTINIETGGYSPKNLNVKAGTPVTLRLVNEGAYGCQQAFTIPKLGIQKVVLPGQSDTVKFTAPKEKGPLAFMCSMGMYRGTINVN